MEGRQTPSESRLQTVGRTRRESKNYGGTAIDCSKNNPKNKGEIPVTERAGKTLFGGGAAQVAVLKKAEGRPKRFFRKEKRGEAALIREKKKNGIIGEEHGL